MADGIRELEFWAEAFVNVVHDCIVVLFPNNGSARGRGDVDLGAKRLLDQVDRGQRVDTRTDDEIDGRTVLMSRQEIGRQRSS